MQLPINAFEWCQAIKIQIFIILPSVLLRLLLFICLVILGSPFEL